MFDGLDELPALDTPRLRLRPARPDDAPELLGMFNDPEVMRYWGGSAVPDLDTARARIEELGAHFRARSLFQWTVTLRGEDRMLGTCTLLHLDRENLRAEVGYALARHAWGQGYAREAVRRLIELAFGPLGLHRLEADVDPRNTRSLTLLERLHFQREGHLRERWILRGEIQDTILLGLLAREWRAHEGLPSR